MSVEPESRRARNLSKTEVSAKSLEAANLVIRDKQRDLSRSERADALRVISPEEVRTWSMQLLLHTGVQEPQTNFPELQ